MKIIVVGIGKVGYTLAEHLCQEGNEVTLIDQNEATLEKAQESLDVMVVKGSGRSFQTLVEAGGRETDIIIATTSSDEVNMLCCLSAKRIGVPYAVARIRDPEYSKEITEIKREMGLDLVINPERETAAEIARILRFPAAISIDPFANGRIELVAYRVLENDPIKGKRLMDAMVSVKEKVLFCAVLRGEKVCIPDGHFVLEAGDIAYLIGKASQIYAFFKRIGKETHGVKNALVIGGGRISYYLCDALTKTNVKVKIIEQNKKRCEDLDELLPNCTIIHGDGTDEKLLEDENIDLCESLVAVTGNDEENLITALYASHRKVPKVIAKVTRDNYGLIMKDLNLDCTVNPKKITAAQIIRFVRALKNSIGSNIETLYKIVDGRAEAIQFHVNETAKHLNEPFRSVKFKRNFIVAAIARKGDVIIPTGNDFIQMNDTVIIVSSERNVSDLNDVFADGGNQ
ncbi:MAG: Trk system potassium transporter TrkA [Lachnospiraceae bacterium]|nr:Trk system potassium transporter TrkA [Lachnospiraceae bacterium]